MNTAKSDPSSKPRVISVSSGAHHLHNIAYDTLKDGPARRKVSPDGLYAQSKYGTVVYARELARRLGDSGVVSIALNPGNVATNLQRSVVGLRKRMIVRPVDNIVTQCITSYGSLLCRRIGCCILSSPMALSRTCTLGSLGTLRTTMAKCVIFRSYPDVTNA